MLDHTHWMQRALQLARLGSGHVAPNPMVGAVLVHDDRVLAEGWHDRFGGPHAEVACLNAFGDRPVPPDAVLYVTLEPCSHHGKTPPCANLLIERGVKRVVVAHPDPFPLVSGSGIDRMRSAGIDVVVGVAEREARWTNRAFIISVTTGRPYIMLKWAASADGFLDRHPRTERGVHRISSAATDVIGHQWRSAAQAILVGSRTVVNDDPSLTVRHVHGRTPIRVVLDREGITPEDSKVFSGEAHTLLFTRVPRPEIPVEQFIVGPDEEPLDPILATLHHKNVRSLIVEGGRMLLDRFLDLGLWDEARVITGGSLFEHGTAAPKIGGPPVMRTASDGDRVELFLNTSSPAHQHDEPDPSWPW